MMSPRRMLHWFRAVRLRFVHAVLRLLTRVHERPDLVRLGSTECGWVVPLSFLRTGAVCYCAGAGEDITFDLALAEKHGCEVVTIDPTPRAVQHVSKRIEGQRNIRLLPVGLWSRDQTLRFYAPRDPMHVSHSVVNLQKTDSFFEAPCLTVSSVMRMLGHSHVTILKLDIEGAQYDVLENVIAESLAIDVICVEFDQPSPITKMVRMLKAIRRAGYDVVNVEGTNFTFVRP